MLVVGIDDDNASVRENVLIPIRREMPTVVDRVANRMVMDLVLTAVVVAVSSRAMNLRRLTVVMGRMDTRVEEETLNRGKDNKGNSNRLKEEVGTRVKVRAMEATSVDRHRQKVALAITVTTIATRILT